MSGFLHLLCLQGLSKLEQVLGFPFFWGWIIFHWPCIHYILFIHPSVVGPLVCFHLLAIVNMVLWALVYQVYGRVLLSLLWGYKPRSGIAESCGNSMFTFLRNRHPVFQRWLRHFPVPPFFLFFSQNSSSATALQHLPFHLHSPNIHPVYKVVVPVPLIRERKKKVALIVKSVVLQQGLAVGDWWPPLHPIRYFILVKMKSSQLCQVFLVPSGLIGRSTILQDGL